MYCVFDIKYIYPLSYMLCRLAWDTGRKKTIALLCYWL